MALRYLSENHTAPNLAYKNNMWIRYFGQWYTPDEFNTRFGSGKNATSEQLQILNPLPYLALGRKMIQDMIIAKEHSNKILNALDRLHRFEDKLRAMNYRPLLNQKGSMPWPYEVKALPKWGDQFKNDNTDK